MCEGEFESLKAIYDVSPSFVPKPYAWGRYVEDDPVTYFLLAEFRDVGEQVSRIYLATLAIDNEIETPICARSTCPDRVRLRQESFSPKKRAKDLRGDHQHLSRMKLSTHFNPLNSFSSMVELNI